MPEIVSSSCHLSRAMSFDPRSMPTLMTSSLPSSTSPTLSGSCSMSIQPRTCADPRGLGGDGFKESDPRTGYEPKSVVDSVIPIVNCRAREIRSLEPQSRWSKGTTKCVIGVLWRLTDGRWKVDRPDVHVDPIPIPPLPRAGARIDTERIGRNR